MIPKTVYISGALSDMQEEQRAVLRRFYEDMAKACSESGLEPYVPHIYGDPKLVAHLTPKQIDRQDRLAVTQAYLMVAYVGMASTGVGIEVELAHHANTPVIILFEKDRLEARKVSRLVRGNPAVIKEIVFDNFDDALGQLKESLIEFRQQIADENLPEPLTLPTVSTKET